MIFNIFYSGDRKPTCDGQSTILANFRVARESHQYLHKSWARYIKVSWRARHIWF